MCERIKIVIALRNINHQLTIYSLNDDNVMEHFREQSSGRTSLIVTATPEKTIRFLFCMIQIIMPVEKIVTKDSRQENVSKRQSPIQWGTSLIH